MSTCIIKFDPRTIYAEIISFDGADRGVLFSLLLEMWCHEGHVENHKERNARRCGVRPTSYAKSVARLVEVGALQISEGRIFPGRRIQAAMRRVGLEPEQRAVVLAEEKQCAYCGSEEGSFHVDHKFPASRGGTNHRRNLTLSCVPCNFAKRAKTPQEWLEQS